MSQTTDKAAVVLSLVTHAKTADSELFGLEIWYPPRPLFFYQTTATTLAHSYLTTAKMSFGKLYGYHVSSLVYPVHLLKYLELTTTTGQRSISCPSSCCEGEQP